MQIQTNLFAMARIVDLGGEGIANGPVSDFNPSDIDFGDTTTGTTTNTKTATLTNSGNQPLAINGFSVSGPFTYTTTCGATLAVGAACDVVITFAPTADGNAIGNFSIDSNASGASASIALRGRTPTTTTATSGTSGGTTTAGSAAASGSSYSDPELISGNNKVGGGAFGIFGLGALALVALRRRFAALAGTAMIVTTGVASAQEVANTTAGAPSAPITAESAAAPAPRSELGSACRTNGRPE